MAYKSEEIDSLQEPLRGHIYWLESLHMAIRNAVLGCGGLLVIRRIRVDGRLILWAPKIIAEIVDLFSTRRIMPSRRPTKG